MTFLEATFSGVVQGMTEFLPISSSGHLVLLHHFFGAQEPQLLFDLYLHLGTTLAVLILFWRKILNILTQEKKFLYHLFLGTLPAVGGALLFGGTIEKFFLQPRMVGVGFWVTAGWLLAGERLRPVRSRELNWVSALLIGMSQAVAMVPGISRSGMTIATGLMLGLKGELAVQYSFLLMIPAVAGAFLYEGFFNQSAPITFSGFFGKGSPIFAMGALTALAVGILAIAFVRRSVEKRKLSFFSLYLLMLGVITFFGVGDAP
ncbi:MAG: undecaprenyl-diphosphate phosphatase [Candidatus Omnitrophota bacterium]